MNWKWWEEAKYQSIIALQSLRFGLHSKWQRINITFNLRLFFPNNELNGVIIFNEQFHFIEWTTSSYHRLNPSNASLRLFCFCGNGIAREQMVTAKSLNKCNIKSPRLRSMQTRIKTAANALHPHVLVLYCLILLLSMWHRLCKSAANTYKGLSLSIEINFIGARQPTSQLLKSAYAQCFSYIYLYLIWARKNYFTFAHFYERNLDLAYFASKHTHAHLLIFNLC